MHELTSLPECITGTAAFMQELTRNVPVKCCSLPEHTTGMAAFMHELARPVPDMFQLPPAPPLPPAPKYKYTHRNRAQLAELHTVPSSLVFSSSICLHLAKLAV